MKKKTFCEQYWHCKKCNLTFSSNTKKTHMCSFFCSQCSKKFTKREDHINHVCYMQPDSHKFIMRQDYDSIVIFDIESMLSRVYHSNQNNALNHQPVLIYAIYLCKEFCMNYVTSNIVNDVKIETNPVCSNEFCGYHSFYGSFCVYDFLTFLFRTKSKKNTVVISHNGSRYDMIFLVRAIANLKKEFTMMPIGNGILSLFIPEYKIKFIDSLCWLKQPLSMLPRAFDFQGEKGMFPYLFNNKQNQGYCGPFPEKEYFNVKNMSYMQKVNFNKWYDATLLKYKAENKHYNLQREMNFYCLQDINILLKAVLIFRSYLLNLFETDLIYFMTLPQIANSIFRNKFMLPDTIAIINDRYNPRKSNIKFSKVAILWLKYMEKVYNMDLQTALSSNGEFKLYDPKTNKNFFVDGFDRKSQTILEFHGCRWHFCGNCNKKDQLINCENRQGNKKKITFHEIHLQDLYRKQFFLSSGYVYKEIKECEFKKQMKHDIKLIDFMKSFDYVSPPKVRDALFGGRTEAFSAFYELQNFDKYEICYYDICSLYPYVLMSKRFPIGYPRIITDNFKNLDSYFGLVQCRILPPTNLYIPVLPYRDEKDKKLYFGLCQICIQNKKFDEICSHTDIQRSWVGFFTTPELQLAIKHGYVVLRIFEIWHFDTTINDDENSKCTGIFGNYFKNFIKMKIESSSWESNGVNPDNYDEKIKFQDYVKNKLDVTIDIDKVVDNPPLRCISKLFLNSTWGRFGMKSLNRKKMKIFSKSEDILKFWNTTQCEVIDVIPLEESVIIFYKEDERYVKPASNLNIIISIFTTSYARIELYNLLEKSGKYTLYTDTDSLITVINKFEHPKYEISSCIGGLKNELPINTSILKFFGLGPKNYCYEYVNKITGESNVKMVNKGFAPKDVENSMMSLKIIKDMAYKLCEMNVDQPVVDFSLSKFKLFPNESKIYTIDEIRKYQACFEKRNPKKHPLIKSGLSTPWGYRHEYK